MTNNTTAHQDALRLVHEEAGRTLSKSDFDLCMRIAKRALLTSPRAAVRRALAHEVPALRRNDEDLEIMSAHQGRHPMSDKLSDEQIERAFDSFKCTHPGAAPWYDVPERFLASTVRRLLAASPAPAITMPTLNDAMRAVLTNENCIYGTPDELYAALVKAAPAISESEDAIQAVRVVLEQNAVYFARSTIEEIVDAARKGEKS